MRSRTATIAFVCSTVAWAQSSKFSGITGAAGNFNYQAGTIAAQANRTAADNLYKQSLADEKAAWSSFPPSVSLLTKSLHEAQNGIKAEDQAHNLAQQALSAIDSGATSGDYSSSNYNANDADALRSIVSSQSPYYPAVSGKLQGYGLALSEDKQYMKSPFGNFPVSMSNSQLASTLNSIASALGMSGAGIPGGIAAADATSDAIGQQAYADAQAKAKASGKGDGSLNADAKDAKDGKEGAGDEADSRGLAGIGGSGDGLNQGRGNGGDGSEPISEEEKSARILRALQGLHGADIDWDARAAALEASRNAMMAQMQLEPIHAANEDIWLIIHVRYQNVDAQGRLVHVIPKH